MWLSDLSVTRPVVAAVMSLILIAFGLVAFDRLSLREYPAIDPPVISIATDYPGTAAQVIESRITQAIEERIAGVEGIAFIRSVSEDGRSRITVEFETGRDIDAAANDIRDRVAGVVDALPAEAGAPEIRKADSGSGAILWLSLRADRHDALQLTDFAERYLVDRFASLDGVARVQIGGGQRRAMRIWLDRNALAARGFVVNDVEEALRAGNVELPAGRIETEQRYFTARVDRSFRSADDFRKLVLGKGGTGYLVRLGDVARIEKGAVDERVVLRRNGVPSVGIGIYKHAQANTLAVADAVRAEAARLNATLPEGMALEGGYDSSIFIQDAIDEVLETLVVAIALVVIVIFLFLGSVRAMLVPAVTVPVSLVAACIVLYVLGLSINMFTLLALVLAIGLIVDDAIVVLENIHRRIALGETPLVAAYLGTRQVFFAVVATTVVLLAVFVPISFAEGDLGRLFSEFSLTIAAAVVFSSFVALSLSPVLASTLLTDDHSPPRLVRVTDRGFAALQRLYAALLRRILHAPIAVLLMFAGVVAGTWGLYERLPEEYAPREDRGTVFVFLKGPEGASWEFMKGYVDEVEARLMPLLESGEATRLMVRAPDGHGRAESFNTGSIIVGLAPWGERRPASEIVAGIRRDLAGLPGIRAFPVMGQALGGGSGKPVQLVLGGGTYEQLAAWRNTLVAAIEEDNPGLIGIDSDYRENRPQVRIEIDLDRAGDLGVSVANVGRTLETFLGGRPVTTYDENGRQYDVLLEGEAAGRNSPDDIENVFVRSERSGALVPLANLVEVETYAGPRALNRYNRVRAVTIEADLAEGYSLGEALDYLDALTRQVLPDTAVIDYKGQSRDLRETGRSALFVFVLGIVVVYLVLAAQFESFVHPLVIMLTVPLAIGGALFGMFLTGGTLNLYTQIGLIMLVGLAAKNGILIVEFVNQLREEGRPFRDAIVEGATVRLRPIMMTGITTVAGAVPLILAAGPSAETRNAIGVVVFAGVAAATLFTLFVVPAAYGVLARGTRARGATRRRLEHELGGAMPGFPAGRGDAPTAE